MRFGKTLYVVAALALGIPAASTGDSLSVLRFFQDGCGATVPEEARFCEFGPRTGFPCAPLPRTHPEFDLGNPDFSPDCCENPASGCFSELGNHQCTGTTRLRCVAGKTGQPCQTNADCDSLVCMGGDPNSLGEQCSTNEDCVNPNFPEDPNTLCGGSRDGSCDLSVTTSVMGHVLRVNDNAALVAVVTGLSFSPQPTNNKKDRLQYAFDFQLLDMDEIVEIDAELCSLPIQFGRQIRPTSGILEEAIQEEANENGSP
jgi:hypothetical protein